MNFKKLIIISILLLTGCHNNSTSNSSSSISSSKVYSSSSSNVSTSLIESSTSNNDLIYDGYYKANNQTLSYKDLRHSSYFKDLPSIGESKMLVVPVKFQDSTLADSVYGGSEKVLNDIEKVFFGKSEETGWESVKTYYQKSSYGKLNITGKVTDWFTLNETFLELNDLPYEEYIDPTIYILREVGKWYQENYDDASEYDTNDDGYIDAIWMVYDYEAKNNYKYDWAHTFWDYMNQDEANPSSPLPYTFAWAGIGFMYEGEYQNENNETLVDAHTFIHETGHLLGLEDYYDYDKKHSYSGCLDMMDYNIGDHTGLSKYLLNWTNPYVITDSCEITINSFTETGDFIILKDNWNHSALDEYLLIEFYTPTGLNHLDSLGAYANSYPQMFQEPGIKIYHVDARIGYFENYKFKFYTDEIMGEPGQINFGTRLAHSNTLSRSCDYTTPLYHLFENGGKTVLHGAHRHSTDAMLFHEGDRFDSYDYTDCLKDEEQFNDGEYINYLIDIITITENEATLKFTSFK